MNIILRCLAWCGLIVIRPVQIYKQRREATSAETRELERMDAERCNKCDTYQEAGAAHLLGCRSDVCPACARYLVARFGDRYLGD